MKRRHVLSSATQHFAAKLAPKYEGPYRVVRRLSAVVYEVAADSGKTSSKVHVKDLKPYLPTLTSPAICSLAIIEGPRPRERAAEPKRPDKVPTMGAVAEPPPAREAVAEPPTAEALEPPPTEGAVAKPPTKEADEPPTTEEAEAAAERPEGQTAGQPSAAGAATAASRQEGRRETPIPAPRTRLAARGQGASQGQSTPRPGPEFPPLPGATAPRGRGITRREREIAPGRQIETAAGWMAFLAAGRRERERAEEMPRARGPGAPLQKETHRSPSSLESAAPRGRGHQQLEGAPPGIRARTTGEWRELLATGPPLPGMAAVSTPEVPRPAAATRNPGSMDAAVIAAYRRLEVLDRERPRRERYHTQAAASLCWNCHGSGHRAEECPSGKTVHCHGCGWPGKHREDCPRCRRGGYKYLGVPPPKEGRDHRRQGAPRR